ncbi:hypothetical protein Dimus_011260 [Dionaea muscipula]
MELNESNSSSNHHQQQQQLTRSILTIDLNETPSPSETLPSPSLSSSTFAAFALSPTSIVRYFHDNPPPPDGLPADIPGEGRSSVCGACGKPEVRGHVVVCDGCEQGFHLGCAGMRGRQAASLEEWVCGECLSGGFGSRRWPLGRTKDGGGGGCGGGGSWGVRFLDMNASPPSEGDGGAEEKENDEVGVMERREEDSRISMARSFEEVKLASLSGNLGSSNRNARSPLWDPSDILLHSLREFITERHGVLLDGWHVELKQSKSCCESAVVYCAPDGKTFETMSDVATYYELVANGISKEHEARTVDGPASLASSLLVQERGKLSRSLVDNEVAENNGSMTSMLSNEVFFSARSGKSYRNKFNQNLNVKEAEKEDGDIVHQVNVGLPVQYEDFFVLSLGKVDARPSYHDPSHIWPVGYRSCWHDKITGSLFLCDVVDDGDTGPLFKVRRFSCSSLPIPYGSTVLYRQSLGQADEQKDKPTIESTVQNMMFDRDCSIETILSDPCLPSDDDVLLWLAGSSDGVRNKAKSLCGSSGDLLNDNSIVGDKIDEFSIDGHSSSLLWNITSQRVTDACRQIYKQTGFVKFFCKHVEYGASQLAYVVNENNTDKFSSLNKFFSLFGAFGIPAAIKDDHEFELAFESLKNWFNMDRFGLDTAFVQEILEQLPAVHGCSRYEFLRSRNCGYMPPMVGNGLLLINAKSGLLLDGKGCHSGPTSVVESPVEVYRCPPSGKLLGSKLPPHLVGDVLQVWEELGRFHEILGLEVAPSIDELESELLSPWYEGICSKRTPAREFQEDGVITSNGSKDSHLVTCIDTGEMREEVRGGLETSTYGRCAGILVKKAQISLLNVLVSELKLKVAAVADPTFDGGESKPRRGRRRDVENSNLTRRSRLSMLPINEYTWPELARRYILAVLCMDGNCESAEAALRESSKIFRCLQGDGGLLCGSLPGVAGIEADALFLAEAMKRIYGSLIRENDVLVIEDDKVDSASGLGSMGISDDGVPEWAQALEPVKKLPTNVGTRIRKCVYEALDRGPPEWARKILEHSISKEVYKGNASGPTKKAVLSVLADVVSETLQPKARAERKKKTVLSISDIIMKKCRIVLRHAISADEDKVFCNLLGRSLMNSFENDDEGLLGSPAMVSRPLDFRTIDFRLAVGAYFGSHEAFLEDVRELWANVRNAHADQPDLVQAAETLSQNFESLYEKEILSLLKSLKDRSESDHGGAEAVRHILVSISEIPKAPWDEGVCKVCGIDKDDDAVLLCDTCDAEYHTYCLNPPLTRIPEGNWYCPLCVSGASEAVLRSPLVLGQPRQKKYHGEVMNRYLEELTHLARSMEEKEYWEFSIDERAQLLKFLCDELLNSVQIHQHLEQCSDISTDLQQRLRSLNSEVKILKVREDVLATHAFQAGRTVNVSGEANIEKVQGGCASNGSGPKPELSDTSLIDCPIPADGLPSKTVQNDTLISDDLSRHPNSDPLKKHASCNGQVQSSAGSLSHLADAGKAGDDYGGSHGNHISNEMPQKRLKIIGPQKSLLPHLPSQEINGIHSETRLQGKRHEAKERGAAGAPPSVDLQGVFLTSNHSSIQLADSPPSLALNESSSFNIELNAVRKELVSLQQSIAEVELQLLNVSVRRELLGNDSLGGLYWMSSVPGGHTMVISDRTIASQRKKMRIDKGSTVGSASVSSNLALSLSDGQFHFKGSNVSCPFVYAKGVSDPKCSQWVAYESDAEIMELIQWLKDNDPKEKELKDSIVQWQKLKSFVLCQTEKGDQDEPPSTTQLEDKIDSVYCVATKATSFLEKKYGSWFQSDERDGSKKRLTRARTSNGERMSRCNCLEPIWPSRYHCLHCHTTFLTAEVLEKHNDGQCCSATAASQNKKETGESSGGLMSTKSEFRQVVGARPSCPIEGSKTAGSDLSPNFIKFCSEGLMSPYRFEEISSKFVTNDSVKQLVQGIGLISSGGIPPFISSLPSHLDDPTMMLVPTQGDLMRKNSTYSEIGASLQDDDIANKACISDDSSGKSLRKLYQNFRSDSSLLRSQERSCKKSSSNCNAYSLEISRCCTVPEASLRPLVGRSGKIFSQLKIALLDIEAALPEEALRPSKVDFERRCSWRAFVKRAVTIFEVITVLCILLLFDFYSEVDGC